MQAMHVSKFPEYEWRFEVGAHEMKATREMQRR